MDSRATSGSLSRWAVIALAAVVMVFHARYYLPFIADDALISLRYADRLLDGHGLTWTAGQPVEGYSNLLWILLVSLPGLVGVDLIVAARVLGVVCSLVVIAAVVWSAAREDVVSMVFGALVLALSGSMAVWAIGGLEQPLVAALLALAILLTFRVMRPSDGRAQPARWLALCLGLLCLTRPDGPIFVVAVVATLVLTRRFRVAGTVGLAALGFVAAQLTFRLAYYGEWLPNPAYIKVTPSARVLAGGLEYIRHGFHTMNPVGYLGIAAIVSMLIRRESRARGVLLALMLGGWLAYLAVIGGDIFPARRHFVVVVVIMAFALADAIAPFVRGSRYRRYAGVVILAAALALFGYNQVRDVENRRAAAEMWEWDGEVVGLVLKRAFGDRSPLLACEAAGSLPYWSQLPSLDMLGLNDHHIARQRPGVVTDEPIAHQFGDGEYVLDRRPDLISFCNPRGSVGACFRSGAEMQADPRFYRWYVPVFLHGEDPRPVDALVWFRINSEKVGVRPDDDGAVIPGYLFRPAKGTIAARPDATGRLTLPLDAGDEVEITLGLPQTPDSVRVVATCAECVSARVEDTGDGSRIVLTATAPVAVAEAVAVLGAASPPD